MAIEVTEEMRRAVYALDCDAKGHLVDFSNAVGLTAVPNANGGSYPAQDVLGPNDETLPHLTCRRCGRVWLIVEDAGDNYPDAVARLQGKVLNPDDFKPRKKRRTARG
jgi:hypothetical protein